MRKDFISIDADEVYIGNNKSLKITEEQIYHKNEPLALKKDLVDLDSLLNKYLGPIGTVYTQYPFQPSPIDMEAAGTWEIMKEWITDIPIDGEFFRIEEGLSNPFEGEKQAQSTELVKHNHDKGTLDVIHSTTDLLNYTPRAYYNSSGLGAKGPLYSDTSTDNTVGSQDLQVSISPVGIANVLNIKGDIADKEIDAETRPVNRTIRLWKRVKDNTSLPIPNPIHYHQYIVDMNNESIVAEDKIDHSKVNQKLCVVNRTTGIPYIMPKFVESWETNFRAPIDAQGIKNYIPSSVRKIPDLARGLYVGNVTNMINTFYNYGNLSDISALSSWTVENVANMSQMFYGCTNLPDISALSSWNVSNVISMSYMFDNCTNLSDISALSSWNVSNVTYMGNMFDNCTNLSLAQIQELCTTWQGPPSNNSKATVAYVAPDKV